ncbi:hypothetical protein [Evansella cellulosilytica]|nr:hypothetical protein [Evansella cellulosilytica]
MMKWVASAAVVSIITTGSYYISKEKNRKQVYDKWNRLKAKVNNKTNEHHVDYLSEKIGHSDPHDIDDNTMVDEGATYAVNYYNKEIRQ